MRGIRHHLLGVYDPYEAETKTVADFLHNSIAAIADIHARGCVAVVVGGTNLYIEKLLFMNSLVGEGKKVVLDS
jgi:tRNA dimethylallyltransferase